MLVACCNSTTKREKRFRVLPYEDYYPRQKGKKRMHAVVAQRSSPNNNPPPLPVPVVVIAAIAAICRIPNQNPPLLRVLLAYKNLSSSSPFTLTAFFTWHFTDIISPYIKNERNRNLKCKSIKTTIQKELINWQQTVSTTSCFRRCEVFGGNIGTVQRLAFSDSFRE